MFLPMRIALAGACAFAAFSGSAQASEADFLKRFHGAFAGGGQVRLDGDGSPHSITCKVSGTSTASSLSIGGTCRAGIMSKTISASLRVGSDGRYTGSFTGTTGTSSVAGRRNGNTVVLTLNGPKKATMKISNSGQGIALSVVSNATQVTQVSLHRQGGTQVASLAE